MYLQDLWAHHFISNPVPGVGISMVAAITIDDMKWLLSIFSACVVIITKTSIPIKVSLAQPFQSIILETYFWRIMRQFTLVKLKNIMLKFNWFSLLI